MVTGYVWITVWLFLVTYDTTTANNCTRCSDFNRQNNLTNKCPSRPDQCGGCNIGFRKTNIPDDGSCEKILPPVLKQQPPPGVYVSEGNAVNLTCKFRPKDKIDCVWMRRGFHLDVSNRYTYIDTAAHGVNTSDCSITIRDLKSTDIGVWQCGSLADSNSDGVMSENTTIGLKERFIETPTGSIVTLKDNITLNCTFDKEVDCVWLRRGFHLEISNRYAFINKDQGKMAKDCSIRITNITSGDLGEWQCGSMADSQKEGLLSKVATLKINQTTPYSKTEKPPSTAKDVASLQNKDQKQPETTKKQHETTPSLTYMKVTTTVYDDALDPVYVTFIIAIVLLGIILITGVVMVLYYKLHIGKNKKPIPNSDTSSTTEEGSQEDRPSIKLLIDSSGSK